MSTDTRRAAAEVKPIAEEFAKLVRLHSVRCELAGSLRRGKADVGDVDIVAQPKPSLYPFLDNLVADGTIQKATYGVRKSPRWGEKLKGIIYQGVKIELTLSDEGTWGNNLWLKTGPADANTYIMSALMWKRAPIRAVDGAWWKGAWTKTAPGSADAYEWESHTKLYLAQEADLFELLGIPFIEPADRSEETYKKYFSAKSHKLGDWSKFTGAPVATVQKSFLTAAQMAEIEWQAAVKAEKNRPPVQIVHEPYEWDTPFLRADGLVWVWHGRRGEQYWYPREQSHPRAEQFKKYLTEVGLASHGSYIWRLQEWLASERKMLAFLQSAVEFIRGEAA